MATDMVRKGSVSKKQHEMSQEEWNTRVDLAACYRLVALYGMTDLDATHISARDPHNPKQFFLNPYGLLFDEITASSLVKCDLDGHIIDSEHSLNMAGYTIHSAVLAARSDAGCVVHTHTRAGMAVSAQREDSCPSRRRRCGSIAICRTTTTKASRRTRTRKPASFAISARAKP